MTVFIVIFHLESTAAQIYEQIISFLSARIQQADADTPKLNATPAKGRTAETPLPVARRK